MSNMANKPDQPPAYPAPTHQDAGPYHPPNHTPAPAPAPYLQSPPPGGYYNGYSNDQPPNGYFSPGKPQYGPPGPQGGYYQSGYQQGYPAQGYHQGYPQQGYYAQGPNQGYNSSDGICAGIAAAFAFCCCADLCCLLI